MKATFLQKIAQEIHQNHPLKLDGLCFVFPSKRSGLFFKKEIAKQYQKALWAPTVLTIDIFVAELSGLEVIGPLEQIFQLFKVHQEQNIQPQLPFENFIDHGKLILADFNDIDMALADADSLFSNVEEYVKLGVWEPNKEEGGDLAKKYLQTFENLPIYYHAYHKMLLAQGKAYQGLAYRHIKEHITSGNLELVNSVLPKWSKIYVAGLNALTPAEKWLFDWLKQQNKLEVYYEGEAQMIDDSEQESGLFMREFSNAEGNKFKWKEDLLTDAKKSINNYAVNGNLAMARMVGELFETHPELTHDNETAVILADENLLLPVLESLPTTIGDVNVTLGFPLGLTPFMSLAEQFFALQKMARGHGSSRLFYFKDVLKVLTNPVLVSVVADEKGFQSVIKGITKKNQVWIPHSIITDHFKELTTIDFVLSGFSDWLAKPQDSISFLNEIISQYQIKIEKNNFADDVLIEQLYFFKTAIGQLQNYLSDFNIPINLDAIRRIFKQIVSPQQVPFSGEPLAGVQIMGLLETRLLSFKNVIFVSVNEGVIPAKGGSQSFLPYNLRKGFGIQTHQHRESLFAYHFYRVLSQAENIHLVYDTSSMGVGSNEKSRFIRQIEQEWPEKSKDIKFTSYVGVFEDEKAEIVEEITKTPEVLENIKRYLTNPERGLSPSALNNYLESPTDFYYQNVIGVQEPNSVDEDVEHNTFGTIVHACLEEFYKPFEKQVLNADVMVKNFDKIDTIIHAEFSKEIPSYKRGKHYMSFYSVKNYVKRFIHLDIEFIRSYEFPITLTQNELRLSVSKDITGIQVYFKGFADRVETRQGVTYIIDYKTGRVEAKDLKVDDFSSLHETIKPKANQVLMYAWMANQQLKAEKVVSGIYSLRDVKLKLYEANVANNTVLAETDFTQIDAFITDIVQEMLNPDIPLKHVSDYQFAMF